MQNLKESARKIYALLLEARGKSAENEIYGYMSLYKIYINQILTGEWSDKYATRSLRSRNENRTDAMRWLVGFLWGLEAAGVIDTEMQKEISNALIEATRDATVRDGRLSDMPEEEKAVFCDKFCKYPEIYDEEAAGVPLAESDFCGSCPLNK